VEKVSNEFSNYLSLMIFRMLIELMILKDWYLIYPNFKDAASLATNFFEIGVHSQPDGENLYYPDSLRRNGDYRFTVPLLQNLPDMTLPIREITWINLYHEKVDNRNSLFMNKTELSELHDRISICF